MKYIYNTIFFIFFFLTIHNFIIKLQIKLFSIKNENNNSKYKVCIILVDGLRLDSVEFMPFLQNISKTDKSMFYKSKGFIPSLSRPSYERIFTGAPTNINGVAKNLRPLPSVIPDIFTIAKKKGLKTALCGFYWLLELYPFAFDYKNVYFSNDKKIFIHANKIISKFKPDIIVIHPMLVDNIGHKYGGASLNYKDACILIDKEIKNIWNKIKDENYILIITSDHGHKDKGGHGDGDIKCIEIPLIFIGQNLKHLNLKNTNSTTQLDIAPTICDILNLPKTIFMQGNSLINDKKSTINDLQNFKYIYNNISKIALSILFIASYLTLMIIKLIIYLIPH